MRLFKIIRGLTLVTLIALIYIHLQMRIYGLAYDGKSREEHIQRLADSNATTACQILELKSVNRLGSRLLSQDNSLKFRDHQSIIQLVTTEPVTQKNEVTMAANTGRENSFLNFLTDKAEARTYAQEERSLFRILGKDR